MALHYVEAGSGWERRQGNVVVSAGSETVRAQGRQRASPAQQPGAFPPGGRGLRGRVMENGGAAPKVSRRAGTWMQFQTTDSHASLTVTPTLSHCRAFRIHTVV
ncbi:unnamed protein product [Pleuronectes platessa]|uniref:Uncharacterized protein n=1 Tax=Pleuronectes platessa TaxID=8262 RepID=A0A9N7U988_PLEPL|nr:unnamed protein product [Pleuronectes platessa]